MLYSRFRNYLYTRMVARAVKLRHILPQANGFLCYENETLIKEKFDFFFQMLYYSNN